MSPNGRTYVPSSVTTRSWGWNGSPAASGPATAASELDPRVDQRNGRRLERPLELLADRHRPAAGGLARTGLILNRPPRSCVTLLGGGVQRPVRVVEVRPRQGAQVGPPGER